MPPKKRPPDNPVPVITDDTLDSLGGDYSTGPGFVEAKKDALSQAQTGEWKLTLKLVDDDLDEWLRRAPMGTRLYLVLVDADTYDAQADGL